MGEVSLSKLRANLLSYVERALAGEDVVVTRRQHPVAVLRRYEPDSPPEKATSAHSPGKHPNQVATQFKVGDPHINRSGKNGQPEPEAVRSLAELLDRAGISDASLRRVLQRLTEAAEKGQSWAITALMKLDEQRRNLPSAGHDMEEWITAKEGADRALRSLIDRMETSPRCPTCKTPLHGNQEVEGALPSRREEAERAAVGGSPTSDESRGGGR